MLSCYAVIWNHIKSILATFEDRKTVKLMKVTVKCLYCPVFIWVR